MEIVKIIWADLVVRLRQDYRPVALIMRGPNFSLVRVKYVLAMWFASLPPVKDGFRAAVTEGDIFRISTPMIADLTQSLAG